MKLYIVMLTAATGFVTNGNAASLRATVSKPLPNAVKTQVFLQGVIGSPSDADLGILGKALVTSYNDAHWQADHFLAGDYAIEQKSLRQQTCGGLCPNDDAAMGLAVSLVAPLKQQTCGGLCPNDDSKRLKQQTCGGLCPNDDMDTHKLLEASFCDKIKSSGSKYWMRVSMCALTFSAHVGASLV